MDNDEKVRISTNISYFFQKVMAPEMKKAMTVTTTVKNM